MSVITRALRTLGLSTVLAVSALSAQAQSSTVCGPDVLATIAKQLAPNPKISEAENLKLQAQLYEQYSFCGTGDAKNIPPTDPFYAAANQCGAKATYTGSLYYEEMSCCGYDPQRRAFACPVKIKQNFGFGLAANPGSREYVLHCVDAGAGFVPVGQDSVHLADSTLAPSWQFAVIANAVDNLQTVQPTTGLARNARSILSWNFKPVNAAGQLDCNYKPIWGNVLEYKIRLNQ
ncbi:hypothetical protein [Ideonella paludis]|uniref:Uncharacterized protein n=1 Tax=Ideonella paludis TaxID=1233411 RepID=A0ABS5DRJ1_9BURK|nr:hypothetical protein [Ideonella paludis]MBQ0933763.1 hypothetical protein [Ideonella paludis]